VDEVKGVRSSRPYHSAVRDEQAAATRARVVAAANHCFQELGWSGTTLAQIAARAGVTPQAVHLSVGPKPALLMAALEHAVAGPRGAEPSIEREVFQDALAPGVAVTNRARAFAAATWAVHERAGALFAVLAQAAQGDPRLQERRTEIAARRFELCRQLVLACPAGTADDVARVTDLVFVLSSTSLHAEFLNRSWGRSDYEDWLTATLTALLDGQVQPLQ
jgi:AcrR family transcriptional regulator